MSGALRPPQRQRLGLGAIQVLVAECLVFPFGLATAAFLGRVLGPHDYGILAVALATGDLVEWTIVALFSRATVQVVGEVDDWRPIAAATLRLQTGIGLVTGAVFFLSADAVAAALGEPALSTSLRLLAFEFPILAAGVTWRNVLTGRGLYRERAVSSAVRWCARFVFVVVLVQAGLAIHGAVLGEILSTVAWLTLAWVFVRIPAFAPPPAGGNRRLWSVARPLFLLALSLRMLDKIGLVALKLLGASAQEAGWYAAAQNFGIAPGLFAVSFAPLLLGALTATIRDGDRSAGRPLVRNALRLVFGMIPFVAFGAGAAPEIVRLIYGPGYEPAARLAIPLLGAAIGLAAVSVASTILSAIDKLSGVGRLVWPVTLTAVAALWWSVPRYGAMGAAVVLGVASLANAAIVLNAVRRAWNVSLPVGTTIRTVAVAAVTLLAGLAWPAYGPMLAIKTVVFVGGIVVSLAVLGEFSGDDRRLARTVLSGRS